MPALSRPRARRSLLAVAAVAVIAVMTACSPVAEPAPASAGADLIADTPVGEKTQWILEVLEAEDDTTAAVWEPELHESFLAQVSAEDVAQLLNVQIRPAAPFTVTAYTGDDVTGVTTLAGSVGEPLDMTVTIDENDQIVGFFLAPAAEP
ncbi:Cpe/LpqF family protein [Microbacterium sp. NPDC089189]|uniref:Cpe/LpqF family protein n=1 Tax=Microbacterium sp. NPDC089189 TaxID=3154972 RepID=UPI003423FE48